MGPGEMRKGNSFPGFTPKSGGSGGTFTGTFWEQDLRKTGGERGGNWRAPKGG